MTVRNAILEDVAEIARLGELFHAEAGWGDIVEYSTEDTKKTLRHLIEDDNGILLVADNGGIVGMCGGLAHPVYFNHAHKSGQELFWWVKPGLRDGTGAKLFQAMEDEARRIGCVSWSMIALDKVDPDLTGRLYRRRGYRATEHTYMKRL